MAKYRRKHEPQRVTMHDETGNYRLYCVILQRKYLFLWLTVAIHTIAVKESPYNPVIGA